MKRRFAIFAIVAGCLTGQTVEGPVMGYVVDVAGFLRPLNGIPGAGHVGEPAREGVREASGDLALLAGGGALRNGKDLDGHWASLHPGAFLDASGQQLLVAAGSREPWRLALPARALAIRVSRTGERVATLLDDESLVLWTGGGKAEYRVAASQWWSFDFAGETVVAYDPAAHSLLEIDSQGVMTPLRKLEGEGKRLALAIDRASRNAVLLDAAAGQGYLVPLAGGETKTLALPDGANRLEAVRGGRAFLLTRDPARPIWVLDPEAAEPLQVIPALVIENGGQK